MKWFEENRLPAAFQARLLQKLVEVFPEKEMFSLEDVAALSEADRQQCLTILKPLELKRFERSFQPLLDEHNKAAMLFEGTSIEDWKKHFKYDHNLFY